MEAVLKLRTERSFKKLKKWGGHLGAGECYLVGAAGEDVCIVFGFPHCGCQVKLHVFHLNDTRVRSFILNRWNTDSTWITPENSTLKQTGVNL